LPVSRRPAKQGQNNCIGDVQRECSIAREISIWAAQNCIYLDAASARLQKVRMEIVHRPITQLEALLAQSTGPLEMSDVRSKFVDSRSLDRSATRAICPAVENEVLLSPVKKKTARI